MGVTCSASTGTIRYKSASETMAERLPIELIGQYQDAFQQFCDEMGSVTSAQVSGIMRVFGQNPSNAEIQVIFSILKQGKILGFRPHLPLYTSVGEKLFKFPQTPLLDVWI